ncbi:FG-GAP repeat domain-containing protein [Desulfogranum japonicum]|uniref:FG-GAP repeat domain-containing protein n=1 Tax=Desulfogranum japonicum TaxID=231447 RepID=UPI0004251D82|nr:VCBS repeat-containing protein [Desulfogranum japonicum]
MFTTRIHHFFHLHIRLLLLCMAFLTIQPVAFAASQPAASQQKKVVFLPFTIQVNGPYDYLENGLSSMLKSRLASRADIVPVSSGESAKRLWSNLQNNKLEAFARELNHTKADFLILGSLHSAENGLRISTYVFSRDMASGPHSFEQPINSIDESMTAMDSLSWEISETIFGRNRPEKSGNLVDTSSGVSAFHTSHPDRTYREGLLSTASIDFISGGQFKLLSTHRSPTINYDIMDINSQDLDGDGTTEILLLSNTTLFIYQFIEESFVKVDEIPLSNHLRLHAVTTADIDNNGIQELYISGNNGKDAISSIMEWKDGNVRQLAINIPYYLNVVQEHGAPVIYGQRSGIKVPYGGPVFKLEIDANYALTPSERLSLPKDVSVYDFKRADVDGDSNLETIVISPANLLQVLDASGQSMWSSQDQYGAGRNFFGTLHSNEDQDIPQKYIKTRIIAHDIDQDGSEEVIVVRNRAKHVPFMPRLRYFDGSTITAMKWDKNRLKPLWETQKLGGYIINTQILSQQDDRYQLVFGESKTSYPFVFWESSSMTLNNYTFENITEKANNKKQ